MTKEKETFQFIPKHWTTWVLVGAVSYFLLIEHREHLFQWLPYLIFALCPLMHIFMHRSHSRHGDHGPQGSDKPEELEGEAYRRGVEEGKKQSDQHHHSGE